MMYAEELRQEAALQQQKQQQESSELDPHAPLECEEPEGDEYDHMYDDILDEDFPPIDISYCCDVDTAPWIIIYHGNYYGFATKEEMDKSAQSTNKTLLYLYKRNGVSFYYIEGYDEGIDFDIASGIKVRTANDCCKDAAATPDPVTLYNPLWIEGEIAILFGDSGSGKSLLAVQIAETIARKGKKVVYFDFELSDKQFHTRCCSEDKTLTYQFSNNFLRAAINPDTYDPEHFSSSLMSSIERVAKQHCANTIIIDNITYLTQKVEEGQSAITLMKQFMHLKRKYGWSLLIIAHTPKRDTSLPIEDKDLGGSKMIFNFADAIFAVGRSTKGDNVRYIKQLKSRSMPIEYSADSVLTCKIRKIYDTLTCLNYSPDDRCPEFEHLDSRPQSREARNTKIRQLHEEGKTLREIADVVGVSRTAVQRILANEQK